MDKGSQVGSIQARFLHLYRVRILRVYERVVWSGAGIQLTTADQLGQAVATWVVFHHSLKFSTVASGASSKVKCFTRGIISTLDRGISLVHLSGQC